MRATVAVLLSLGLSGSLGGCVFYLNPLCTDQIANGDETGIDCGGTCPGKCEIGDGCKTSGDCDDADCVAGVCTPKPCANGMKGQQETDVDCGGGTCRPCAGGRMCAADTDCFGDRPMRCDPISKTCFALTVAFAPEVRYFSGYKAYALLSGDLNGDSQADLAVINEYGSSVAVFLGSADGTFARLANSVKPPDEPDNRALNFGPTGAYPTGGGVVDFNHDGKPDVVTADYHGYSVTVLLNDGTGKLKTQAPPYPTQDKAETSNLAVADLNNDGNPDVVATNPQTASVSVFLGDGQGNLGAANNLAVGVMNGAQPYSVAIADFNGDHNNDLAIAEEMSGNVFVRLGHGDGTFDAELPYAIDGTRDYIIIARDMNVDGKLDLVVANRNGDTVSVLLGRGDGTFRKAIVASVGPPGVTKMMGRPWFGPYSVAVADVNQDGVPDIVTPNFVGDSVSILIGKGDGSFEPATELNYAKPIDPMFTSTTPYGIVVGDFNGDGKPDIATANAGSDDLTIRINTGQKR